MISAGVVSNEVSEDAENQRNKSNSILNQLCFNNNINVEQYQQDPRSIQHLEMVFYNYTEIKGLEFFPALTSLCLISQDILTMDGLQYCPNLEKLWICETQISKIENLDSLKNLKWLIMYANQLSKIEGLEQLVKLEKLCLSDNRIEEIENLENLRNLKELDLSANQIRKINSHLLANRQLEILNLAGNHVSSVMDILDLSVSAPDLKIFMLNDGVHGSNPVSLCQNLQSLIIQIFGKLERFDHLKIHADIRLKVNAVMLRKKLFYEMEIKRICRNIDLMSKYLAPHLVMVHDVDPITPEERLVSELSMLWNKKINEIIVEYETAGNLRLVQADPITDPIVGPLAKSFAYRNDSICFFRKIYLKGSGGVDCSSSCNQKHPYTLTVLSWQDKELVDLVKEEAFESAQEISDIPTYIDQTRCTISSLVIAQRFEAPDSVSYVPLYTLEIVKTAVFDNTVKSSLRILIENPSRNLEEDIKSFGDKISMRTLHELSVPASSRCSTAAYEFFQLSQRGVSMRSLTGKYSLFNSVDDAIVCDTELPRLCVNFEGVLAVQLDGCLSIDVLCLLRFSNIRQLSLNNSHLNDVSCLPLLVTIEELSLNGNDLHNIDDLGRLPNLQALELRNNRIREIDVAPNNFTSLISLDVRGNGLTNLKFATKMPQLLVLYAEDNKLDAFASIYDLKRAQQLMSLFLEGNAVCNLPNFRLYTIFHGTCLQRLNGDQIQNEERSAAKSTWNGVLTFESLQDRFPNLDLLTLQELNLSDCSIKRLQCFPDQQFKRLTNLNLEGNSLQDGHCLLALNHLQKVNLSKNKISKLFTVELAEEQYWKELRELFISSNRIESLDDLHLSRFPNLCRLNASKNRIGSIVKTIPCPHLTHLNLNRNKIRALHVDTFLLADQIQVITMRENRLRALMAFSNLRELRELYLNNNFIGDSKEIPMIDLPSIELLSLCNNPLAHQRHYRLCLILQFPLVKTIDDIFVTQMERERAKMIEDIRVSQGFNSSVETGSVYMLNSGNALLAKHNASGSSAYLREEEMTTPLPQPIPAKVSVLSMSLDVQD